MEMINTHATVYADVVITTGSPKAKELVTKWHNDGTVRDSDCFDAYDLMKSGEITETIFYCLENIFMIYASLGKVA